MNNLLVIRHQMENIINDEPTPPTGRLDSLVQNQFGYRLSHDVSTDKWIMGQHTGDSIYYVYASAGLTFYQDSADSYGWGSCTAGYTKNKVVTPITFPYTTTANEWICYLQPNTHRPTKPIYSYGWEEISSIANQSYHFSSDRDEKGPRIQVVANNLYRWVGAFDVVDVDAQVDLQTGGYISIKKCNVADIGSSFDFEVDYLRGSSSTAIYMFMSRLGSTVNPGTYLDVTVPTTKIYHNTTISV